MVYWLSLKDDYNTIRYIHFKITEIIMTKEVQIIAILALSIGGLLDL